MTLYLAGPMRRILLYNFPAFDRAAEGLRKLGHTVISPAELDRERGFFPSLLPSTHDWSSIPEGFDLHACILDDVQHILKADALVVLPGWKESVGCCAEIGVARWAGKQVLMYEEAT